MLKALARRCRTSLLPDRGDHGRSAPDYLALPNVRCVGMSTIVTKAWLAASDWTAIRNAARAVAKLAPNLRPG